MKGRHSSLVFAPLILLVGMTVAALFGNPSSSHAAMTANRAGNRLWLPPQQATAPAVATAAARQEAVLYLRYDVQIAVQEDGTFHVREEQEILFNESFRTAFAEIPLDYVGEIRNIQLSSAGITYRQVSGNPSIPGNYSVTYERDAVYVEWMYEETSPGESRMFILEYDVAGGLWVYEDGDILEWRAVPADRSGVPVLSSTVTVTLPRAVANDALLSNAFGPQFSASVSEGQVVFAADDEIPDGTAFQIMVGFPHGLVGAQVQPWQRAEDSADLEYTIRSVETEIEIAADGALNVSERQTVVVDAGVLYGGQRTVSLAYVDGLVDFSVSEGQEPLAFLDQPSPNCESCAWTQERPGSGDWIMVNSGTGAMTLDEEEAGHVQVAWTAPPLVRGEETAFLINYTAVGALQVSDTEQVLAWTPVSGFDVAVESTRLIVDLPPQVTPEEVQVSGGNVQTAGDGRLVITRDGPLAPQEFWEVRLSLPANATAAAIPVWQQELEAAVSRADAIRASIREQEIRRARLQLAFGVGAVLLLVGGLLLVGLVWYLWGRESATPLVPEYLSEPPSDLPPGIVAYLLDEKPTPKGVLASLFHLATLGLLRIELTDPLLLSRNWGEDLAEGQIIETEDGNSMVVPRHMVQLFNSLRPHLGTTLTPLQQITPYLPEIIPQVYYEMGKEATRFFAQLPGQVRRRWLVYGQWVVLGGAGLALAAALVYSSSLGWIAATPAVALVIAGAALIVVSRWMPRRSDVGVEEAARWRAFEQYLRKLQRYGNQEDAQRILNRNFAYAVALDVEDVVLTQAAKMDTVMPTWTQPVVIARPQHAPFPAPSPTSAPGPLLRRPASQNETSNTATPEARRETASRTAPSLEGLADTLAWRLEQANNSVTSTLRKAVGEVSETPFQLVLRGARGAGKLTWDATTTSLEIMDAILDEASSGSGSSSYRGSSGSRRSSSRSSWGSSRSSGFSGRSSSSRRSGGGGRRGFGR